MLKPPAPAINQADFVDLAGGVTLMQASFDDHAFERHSHDCFAVGITTYGVQSFHCKGERHNSQVGDLVLFNPDEDHDGNRGTDDGFRYTIWYIPDDFIGSCVGSEAGLALSRYFASPHVADPQLAQAFGALSASLRAAPSEALRVESLMRSYLGAVLARHGERPQQIANAPRDAGAAALARVKDYMRACYQRNITVTELASLAGLSRAHLSRAFTAAYHAPPHVYLNAVRIARAQSLIRLGTPLATVAVDCGFADQSHLTRRFKGSVGVSPSAWRERLLAR